MEDLSQMLQGVLSDPDMMSQIMGLAQSLGKEEPKAPEPQPREASPLPDLSGLQSLTGLLSKAGIDSHQKALLTALTPYVSHQRVEKLRRAMEAARIAQLASSMLGR